MTIRFTMLGSGAVRDNPRRAGPSQILQVADQTLMFDCGRSAATSLAVAGGACEDIDRLFLTHLHFDHVVDLPYIAFTGWVKGRKARLGIHGPVGTADFVTRIIRPPFEQDIESRVGHGKDLESLDPEVFEVDGEGEFLVNNGYRVSAARVDHAGMPALVYRVDAGGHRVVITGDGKPDERFIDFCRGADLLAVECSGTPEFLATQPWGHWHLRPADIARIASEADVKRVMIKHLVIEDITGDRTAPYRMAEQIREGYSGEVLVAEDGMVVDIS
ncbi:MAG: MBL fold metallo-hydrolase [Candidatus Latescibacteria bacterium]|jgi:ribonuclease Z|nr:MBL fold metallo-hydrolase [Candidatus Latescibacterota bacterium]